MLFQMDKTIEHREKHWTFQCHPIGQDALDETPDGYITLQSPSGEIYPKRRVNFHSLGYPF